ncbi:MAG: hypothetical protein H0U97_03890 [Gammaproteobacteria bacterium]|nr:hypothetical protein [Gammaproteobacteria bacterium]
MLEQELRKYQQHVMSQSWSEFAQVEKIVQISSQFRNRERIRSEMSQVDDNNRNFRGSMKAALFVLVLLIVAALVSAFGYKFFALVTLFFSIGIFIQLVLIASGSNKVEIYLPPFRLVKVIPVALVAASLFARFVAAVTPIRKLTGVWNEDAPLIGTVRNYVTEGSSPGGLGPPQSGTKGQANTKP